MKEEKKWVMVIHEVDLSNNERDVIGVASNRENAKRIIEEYYGKESVQSNFLDVRDSYIDFCVSIHVPGNLGGDYRITVEDFLIDDVS